MITVSYTPSFLKQLRSLPEEMQEEVVEKIEFFKNVKNHKILKVHKLKGRLRGCYAFAVNYRLRVVFQFMVSKEVVLLAVGDHDVYRD